MAPPPSRPQESPAGPEAQAPPAASVGRLSGAREELLHRVIDHLARHGIGDTSLRALADAIGTSHRMVLYHFGSREGLLSAVVDWVETSGRVALAAERASGTNTGPGPDDPLTAGLRFWRAITDQALIYGPLFFELTSHAMIGLPHAVGLRDRLVDPWIDALAANWTALGVAGPAARTYARMDLAMARGLLHDLLLTGDRPAVDAAMRDYAATAIASRPLAPSPPTAAVSSVAPAGPAG